MTGQHISLAEWRTHLAPDEKLLWQGRPDGAFHLAVQSFFAGMLGVASLAGFVWVQFIAQGSGGAIEFWSWLLLPAAWWAFSAGLFGPTRILRRSHYALSNKRAFIMLKDRKGAASVASYPNLPDMPNKYSDGPLPSIWFSRLEYENEGRVTYIRIGFERILDGAYVYRLMRGSQEDAR